ncbi:hypothetical protein JZ751_027992 [Albula glossodonta]|uniref:LIM zinc-binding domain-containing protein n=1 Tax=Albula glossodonta TaxID=121402 RepID=A0A8T2PAH6_9TELE|nr:hypothetical protein JZ751_027992 [Albula glossodonta]
MKNSPFLRHAGDVKNCGCRVCVVLWAEVKSGSPSQAIEDSKRKSSLLKDNSWIRKDMDEDEPVDRDPNFGRAVLSRFKSNEKLDRTPVTKRPTKTETFTERVFSDVKSSSKPPKIPEVTTVTTPKETMKDGYEYTSVSSPTVYTKTSSYLENRPLDSYSDTIVTKPISTVYSTSDRSIIGKDMCTYCRKPLNSEPKMILEDMQIHCHASCFMCEVCNRSLGHLKAGDSMWIYRRTVHCDRCFEMTRGTVP